MSEDFTRSAVAELDREIEDTMGRIMDGHPKPGDFGRVSDLAAHRVEISEPPVFARLRSLLGIEGGTARS